MLLLLHITIALSSIVYTTYLLVAPTKAKFSVSYILIGSTLTSGTYLVISTHAHMLQACTTGLIYLGVVLSGVATAHYRLANARANNRHIDQ